MDPKTKVDEMDDGYANGPSAAPVISLPPTPITSNSAGETTDPALTLSNPDVKSDVQNITVYANSINPVSYMGDDPIVSFDVVFSVGIVCPDGSTKTYQVVKRIGVDRQKMAADAQSSTPVSIVEAKQPSKKGMLSTARLQQLAGLK